MAGRGRFIHGILRERPFMASVFKKSYTSWLLPDGARAKPNAAGARKVKSKSPKWYGQYRDQDGIVRTVALATDKAAARAKLAELVRTVQEKSY